VAGLRGQSLLPAVAALVAAAALAFLGAVASAAWSAHQDPARLGALVEGAVQRGAPVPWLAVRVLVLAGQPGAARRLGLAELPGRPAEGRTWLERAALQGDPRAACALAVWWRSGKVEPRSQARALPWLERAAEGGSPAAHFLLGEAYREGDGVPRDVALALAHYQVAAEADDPQALQTLAEAYRVGELGLAVDPERAEALRRDLEHAVHEIRAPY
jgi:TPR repeat protein